MNKSLYLHQSRRLHKIIKTFIGNSHWTNYSAWEYSFISNHGVITLDLAYTNDWVNTVRFTFISTSTRDVVLQTDSIKHAVGFININKLK